MRNAERREKDKLLILGHANQCFTTMILATTALFWGFKGSRFKPSSSKRAGRYTQSLFDELVAENLLYKEPDPPVLTGKPMYMLTDQGRERHIHLVK